MAILIFEQKHDLRIAPLFCPSVAFHIITYKYYMYYVTLHASHNTPSMYHFTHGYTHRLHTRMQAIVRTYNLPVHTRMCIIM